MAALKLPPLFLQSPSFSPSAEKVTLLCKAGGALCPSLRASLSCHQPLVLSSSTITSTSTAFVSWKFVSRRKKGRNVNSISAMYRQGYDQQVLNEMGDEEGEIQTVQYDRSKQNRVSLIGIIEEEPEVHWADDGTCWTESSLRVSNRSGEDDIYVLEIEGNSNGNDSFAELVANNVFMGDEVLVEGSFQFRQLPPDSRREERCPVIIVDKLFKVERKSSQKSPPRSRPSPKVEVNPAAPVGPRFARGSMEEEWRNFFEHPEEYWDNRKNKASDRSPDFKHKTRAVALWLDSRALPFWVRDRLNVLDNRRNASD